jgi:hypothetical protein
VVLKSEEYVALLRIPMSLSIVVLKSMSLRLFIAATLSDIRFNTTILSDIIATEAYVA